ncbi:2S seed storage protein 3 [Hirschfeldia incana]|nr:2S seed storage protein 3 [Hirschfeldia incana]
MANKLFLVSATLAFFFLLTNASIYRTVVEFDEDDATNLIGTSSSQQKCSKEFQQSQHLRACQQWIHRQAMKPHVGPGALDGEFEDDMENPQGPQQRPPLLQQCCNELHQEDTICVCPALKHASKEVRIQVQQGQQQGHPQIVSRIYQTATHLPNICNVQQVSVCPFQHDMPFPPYY